MQSSQEHGHGSEDQMAWHRALCPRKLGNPFAGESSCSSERNRKNETYDDVWVGLWAVVFDQSTNAVNDPRPRYEARRRPHPMFGVAQALLEGLSLKLCEECSPCWSIAGASAGHIEEYSAGATTALRRETSSGVPDTDQLNHSDHWSEFSEPLITVDRNGIMSLEPLGGTCPLEMLE
ncbi:uncharacterized protein PAC_15383 [Phialocephala subalpina]|uniref:Uncharacterized protein n=1 Tax=Phialocephala subalpina TaxID=576137 RepID=A0A1L7XKE6_9HELO|nr:uncharacterized protein PAC_15383 [Phialocephala subalpina]